MSAREQMRSRLQDQLCHDLGDPVMQFWRSPTLPTFLARRWRALELRAR